MEAELSGATAERSWTPEERLAELKAMLGRVVDPEKRMKLLELISKEEERHQKGNNNHLLDTDGFGAWRVARDFIRLKMGAAAYAMSLWAAHGPQSLCCVPFLHDIATNCQREAPWLWARLLDALKPDDLKRLEGHLAAAGYQFDARAKLWGEVGVTISGKARGNGAATEDFDDVREEAAA